MRLNNSIQNKYDIQEPRKQWSIHNILKIYYLRLIQLENVNKNFVRIFIKCLNISQFIYKIKTNMKILYDNVEYDFILMKLRVVNEI